MKRKSIYLIICSLLILPILSCTVYADEEPAQNTESLTFGYGDASELSSIFWSNYILLPYIESSGSQYINTGIHGKSDLKLDLYFSNLSQGQYKYSWIFGCSNGTNRLSFERLWENDMNRYQIGVNDRSISRDINEYNISHIQYDNNKVYIDNDLIYTFTYSQFDVGYDLYLLSCNEANNVPSNYYANCRVYYFSIYDYDADSGNGALVRSYYPARSKSGSVVGLYDAINDVFYPSSGSDPFELPDGSDASLSISSRIGTFLYGSVNWISSILDWVWTQPLIMIFIVIGLTGVMLRWARRVVHF